MGAVCRPMDLVPAIVARTPVIAGKGSFVVEANARTAAALGSAVETTTNAATGLPASTTAALPKTGAVAASTTINVPGARFARMVIASKTTKAHARSTLIVPTVNFAWSANVCSNVETIALVPKANNVAALAWVARSVWSPSNSL